MRQPGRIAQAVFLVLAAAAMTVATSRHATALAPAGPQFRTLHKFTPAEGSLPYAGIVQATDGNLYGTTFSGGIYCEYISAGCGTIFKVTPRGDFKTIFNFNGHDGEQPSAPLIEGSDGYIYGTTIYGGETQFAGDGTVFRFGRDGVRDSYSFCKGKCSDGAEPESALVQGRDGSFYGTTLEGGVFGKGTIFRIGSGRVFQTLHTFDGTDGMDPASALLLASDGNFYGTTQEGGANGYGTVFEFTPQGVLTTLYNFDLTDGYYALGPLLEGPDGYLYGTTELGGEPLCGYDDEGCGTIYKISTAGDFKSIFAFCNPKNGCGVGANPSGPLILGSDGNLYGTTFEEGAFNGGTIFQLSPSGGVTGIHDFCKDPKMNCPDGQGPDGLLQDTNGAFYGTTRLGGFDGCTQANAPGELGSTCGTVFALYTGLPSFVEMNPVAAHIGDNVAILGTRLSGATSVLFNGAAATFTVISGSLIEATVPSGATTGKIQVVTPNGTLSSNVAFILLK